MTVDTLIKRAASEANLRLRGCIAFNRDADKLISLGESVLPRIEKFIASQMEIGRHGSGQTLSRQLPGLSSLFAVYFRLAANSKLVDASEFLLSLPSELRAEALRAVLIRWGPAVGPGNRPIPKKLEKALHRLAENGTRAEHELAVRLLTYLSPRRAVAKTG